VKIMATIAGESAAFWNKDFTKWASYWVHAPYVRVVGWWPRGGVTVREGWETVSGDVQKLMQRSPQPNPTATQVRRENVNLQVRGNVAWLTYDGYAPATGDSLMDMPGLTRETRVLEKHGGKWRIAYVGWLLQGSNKD
jgi:ketosteroid isomerase-like protein